MTMRFHESFLLREAQDKAAVYTREARLGRDLRELRRSGGRLPRQRLARILVRVAAQLSPEAVRAATRPGELYSR